MTLKKLISVVLPGVLLVLANFLFFAKQFRALDFPAFDLPAKTNSKPSSGGAFFIFNTPCMKVVLVKMFCIFLFV